MADKADLGSWLSANSHDVAVRLLQISVGHRSRYTRWGLAITFFSASLGIRLLFDRWLQQIPFLTFFPAIVGTALLCRWPQAVFVLGASTVASYHFLPTPRSVLLGGTMPISAFLFVGGGLVVLVSALAELVRSLEAATKARDALYQEMQHRVANNLQLVASMLEQARRAVTDDKTARILDRATTRTTSMSLIHRRLAHQESYSEGLNPIMTELLDNIFQDTPVRTVIDICRCDLSFDRMNAIVLLASEAATNAAKHVFRAGLGSVFEIRLATAPGGRLRLLISDDGPGLQQGNLASEDSQGLGMRIMHALARQLGGKLVFAVGPGTTFFVEFRAQ
jgi:two-component sensor histidine kinase